MSSNELSVDEIDDLLGSIQGITNTDTDLFPSKAPAPEIPEENTIYCKKCGKVAYFKGFFRPRWTEYINNRYNENWCEDCAIKDWRNSKHTLKDIFEIGKNDYFRWLSDKERKVFDKIEEIKQKKVALESKLKKEAEYREQARKLCEGKSLEEVVVSLLKIIEEVEKEANSWHPEPVFCV